MYIQQFRISISRQFPGVQQQIDLSQDKRDRGSDFMRDISKETQFGLVHLFNVLFLTKFEIKRGFQEQTYSVFSYNKEKNSQNHTYINSICPPGSIERRSYRYLQRPDNFREVLQPDFENIIIRRDIRISYVISQTVLTPFVIIANQPVFHFTAAYMQKVVCGETDGKDIL